MGTDSVSSYNEEQIYLESTEKELYHSWLERYVLQLWQAEVQSIGVTDTVTWRSGFFFFFLVNLTYKLYNQENLCITCWSLTLKNKKDNKINYFLKCFMSCLQTIPEMFIHNKNKYNFSRFDCSMHLLAKICIEICSKVIRCFQKRNRVAKPIS